MLSFNKKILLILALILICMQMGFAGGNKESALNNGTAGTSNIKGAESFAWITQNSAGEVEYGEPQKDEANAVPPMNAIGIVYYNSAGGTIDVAWFDEEQAWLSQWITYIADSINQVTFRVALAIHPFPSIMFSLYDIEAATENNYIALKMTPKEEQMSKFSADKLLITNDYYKNDADYKTINGFTLDKNALPTSEKNGARGENSLQFKKWSVVTLLFVTCFVAEILFTAIFGYATGSSEEGGASLLKNIAKKIAITLVVFVLVSALPFLLESFRYGLFNVAYAFYGEAAENYNDILVKQGYMAPKIINSRGTVTNMFELPGYFMLSMKDFFTNTGSSAIENSIASAMTKSSGDSGLISVVTHIVTWIVATIYRFFMFFMVLKAAIHISRNILEIYILLGLVMILTPFSVFTPTKTIGSKCIMSLITNVIECFIILVIILTIIPAVKTVAVSIIGKVSALGRPGTYSWEVAYEVWMKTTTADTRGNADVKIGESSLKMIAGTGYMIEICELGTMGDKIGYVWYADLPNMANTVHEILVAEGVKFRVDISKVTKPSEMSEGDIVVKQINGSTGANIKYDSSANVLYIQSEESGGKDKGYPILLKSDGVTRSMSRIFASAVYASGMMTTDKAALNSSYNVKNALQTAKNNIEALHIEKNTNKIKETMWKELYGLRTVQRQDSLITNVIGGVATYEYKNVITSITDVGKYTVTASQDNAVAYTFMQFTLIFMGMFIPCFFVQQSTQITNSLMHGSAGMESLSNAMSDVMRRTGQSVGRIANGIQSAGGNIFGAINRHNANQSAKDATAAARTTAANTSTLLDLMNEKNKG